MNKIERRDNLIAHSNRNGASLLTGYLLGAWLMALLIRFETPWYWVLPVSIVLYLTSSRLLALYTSRNTPKNIDQWIAAFPYIKEDSK